MRTVGERGYLYSTVSANSAKFFVHNRVRWLLYRAYRLVRDVFSESELNRYAFHLS